MSTGIGILFLNANYLDEKEIMIALHLHFKVTQKHEYVNNGG